MQSISVVLPAPLWPMRPRISPVAQLEVDVVDGGDAAEALEHVAALEHDGASVGGGTRGRGVHGQGRRRRRRPAVLLVVGLRLAARRRAGDEHRAEDVGPVEQLRGRAREADLALLHEHGPLGQVQRHVDRLLDDRRSWCRGVDLAGRPRGAGPTIVGARPRDSSSIISSSGRVISAPPRASICCSPPERLPAICLYRSLRIGNSSEDLVAGGLEPVLVLADEPAGEPQVLGDGEGGEHALAAGHERDARGGW